MVLLETFFFSRKPNFFLFYNFNTATQAMAVLKIKISVIIFDMVLQQPALNGSKKHLLGHIRSLQCYNFDNFANASMMTENGQFLPQKIAPFLPKIWSS
jgi:hypothetical protein